METLIRKAIKLAKTKSDHHQHKMAALIIRGGSIIALGANKSYVHAEHCALNRMWEGSAKGATMLLVRVRKNGTLGLAKPCELCAERLARAGVKKVIYSTQSGQFDTMRITFSGDDKLLRYHFMRCGRDLT